MNKYHKNRFGAHTKEKEGRQMEDNKKINEKKPEDLADEQMEDVSGGWRTCEGGLPPVPVKFLVRDDVIPQAGKDADFLRHQFRGQWVDAKAYNKQCDGQYYSIILKYYNVVLKTVPVELIKGL